MPRLLARTDLIQGPESWIPKLGRSIRRRRDLHTLPELVRNVTYVLALDDEVREGGFAQYFFNPACAYVFDTWDVLGELDPPSADLLAAALSRVGAAHVIDLDIERMSAQDPTALEAAYGRLIDVISKAREEPGTLVEQFVKFRERYAPDLGELEGFTALYPKWCEQKGLHEAVANIVLANRFDFFD